jgi:DNA end-binding protein Ku
MRVVWKGAISFGLVSIPVRLYVATESKNVPSRQIHVSDGGRVQYKRVCALDGAEVPYEEVGTGYETASGETVVLSDGDLAMLPSGSVRSIDVASFLPVDSIDPIYFDRSYYVEPEPQATKAYLLLRDALATSGRVAVANVTLHKREILAVLRVRAGVIVLVTMLWPDEVRVPSFPFLAKDDESAQTPELAMADALIASLSEQEFTPARYRDVHRDALAALIDAKATGRPVPRGTQGEAASVDLLTALRASVEAAKQRKAAGVSPRGRKPAAATATATTAKPRKAPSRRRHDAPPGKRA